VILPFKGSYRYLIPEAARRFRGNIYPVPDPRMPFLGVHVTRGVDGAVSVGPTATPAFGRENYGIVSGMRPGVGLRMAWMLGRMVALDRQGLRGLVASELGHYTPRGLLRAARALAPGLSLSDFSSRTKVGLRAQLVDRRSLSLVTDFVIEEGPSSLHVLNAISPAFTSSFALAEMLADRITAPCAPPPPSTRSARLPR
jgi:L-2-hydroxyglutarate oxidase LhgO